LRPFGRGLLCVNLGLLILRLRLRIDRRLNLRLGDNLHLLAGGRIDHGIDRRRTPSAAGDRQHG
jgi:hypothetical protein